MKTPKLIFIVEDDGDIREALALLLRMSGYAVAEAGNGREALAYLEANAAPDLILMDLMMPVMDGVALQHAIWKLPARQHIPTIILSVDNEGRAKARELGAVSFLKKPIEVEALIQTVERHCAGGVRGDE